MRESGAHGTHNSKNEEELARAREEMKPRLGKPEWDKSKNILTESKTEQYTMCTQTHSQRETYIYIRISRECEAANTIQKLKLQVH